MVLFSSPFSSSVLAGGIEQNENGADPVLGKVLRRHLRVQVCMHHFYFDHLSILPKRNHSFRHVVLPPEVAKLLPKNRLLSEVFVLSLPPISAFVNSSPLHYYLLIQKQNGFAVDCLGFSLSGERLECNRVEDGYTTPSTVPSHISCCTAGPSTTSKIRRRPPLLQVSRCLPNDFHFSRVWLVTLWLLVYIRIAYWVVFSHG